MNHIVAQIDESDYQIYSDFLNISLDGQFLDEYLEVLYPGEAYKGTIPTLLFSMEIEAESEVVWRRILPELNAKTVCPILMCPDDRDFSCTIVVAEIECLNDTIVWHKMGLDISQNHQPEFIGSSVRWFEKVPSFQFSTLDYLAMINAFKIQFENDKAEWIAREQMIQ
ncbi:hypothetical protein [Mucilaginibacter agri]|uniref:Uncharacterized protein n=1 Tax=Mucilaginibacter agri TaxID=2695265 RepID=A0A965ZI92_9SPHI|nr:hypothetical protein [Mucilaginibacter agri]NCD70186.1 hypothetical protein [Mucilaginibacter agri]